MIILAFHKFHYLVLVAIVFNGFAFIFTFKLDKRFTKTNWIGTSMKNSILKVAFCYFDGIHLTITLLSDNS